MWGSDPGLWVCRTRTSKRPTDVDGFEREHAILSKNHGGALQTTVCSATSPLHFRGQFELETWKKEKEKNLIYFITHNAIFCFLATTTEDSHKAQPNPIHVNMFYSVHFLLVWTDIWGQPSKKFFVSMIIRNFKPLSAFGQHHTVLFLCHFTSWCDVLFSSPVIPALHLQLSPFNKILKIKS